VQKCRNVVNVLLQQAEVAVDIEGVDLGRAGKISIIQVCMQSTKGRRKESRVYLFDITRMGEKAFSKGRLRELMQSPSVCKLIFDARADNDALHHLYDARMCNCFDLQVQYAFKHSDPSDPYLKGLEKCLATSDILNAVQSKTMSELKQKGRELFVPQLGGSFAVWEQRPLHPELLEYAAVDVKYMIQMKEKNEQEEFNAEISRITQERIHHATSNESSQSSGGLRDFSLPTQTYIAPKHSKLEKLACRGPKLRGRQWHRARITSAA
jgi:exonuclease 3'-5' domain-containing protein 1